MNVTWNKGNERKVYDRIRTRVTKEPVHMIRVENVAEQGTPDIEIAYKGLSAWIETKYIKVTIKGCPLRPAQNAWHYLRAKVDPAGVMIIAGNEDWFVILRPPYTYGDGIIEIPKGTIIYYWKGLSGKMLLDLIFGLL